MEGIVQLLNLPILVSSLIGFIILWMVLKKFLWKAVLDVIDERRESIETAFQEVDDAREDVKRMKLEYEQKLTEINAEAQAKLQEAVAKGQQIAAEIKTSAEESREAMTKRAQADINREKDKVLAELRNAAIDLSFSISQRVMRDGLDKEHHDSLAQSFVDELRELN